LTCQAAAVCLESHPSPAEALAVTVCAHHYHRLTSVHVVFSVQRLSAVTVLTARLLHLSGDATDHPLCIMNPSINQYELLQESTVWQFKERTIFKQSN